MKSNYKPVPGRIYHKHSPVAYDDLCLYLSKLPSTAVYFYMEPIITNDSFGPVDKIWYHSSKRRGIHI